MSRKNRKRIRIQFTKSDGKTTSFWTDPPHDWYGMSSIRRLAWAQHAARNYHAGASKASVIDEG